MVLVLSGVPPIPGQNRVYPTHFPSPRTRIWFVTQWVARLVWSRRRTCCLQVLRDGRDFNIEIRQLWLEACVPGWHQNCLKISEHSSNHPLLSNATPTIWHDSKFNSHELPWKFNDLQLHWNSRKYDSM